jgi:ABC-type sugar transport system ATPase subunit
LASITLESVSRRQGRDQILTGVDLHVADGECMAVLGRSGSGKSSVLRVIAGLDKITHGRVLFDDVDVVDVEVHERDVALAFQDNTLFRRLSARRNVAFPLTLRKRPLREVSDRVEAESRALDIEHILDRFPDQLSEGHQQLVQIARVLVRVPRMFLLDEPLARLDPPTRLRVRNEIRLLQSGYGVTMLWATNDPTEAMAIADRVAVIERGRIVQVAEPFTLWRQPIDRATATLTGVISFVDATVEGTSEGFWVSAEGLRLRAWPPALAAHVGKRVQIGIRPDAVRLDPNAPTQATLGRFTFEGAKAGREVRVGPHRVASHVGADDAEGTSVSVSFDHWQVFDDNGLAICSIG